MRLSTIIIISCLAVLVQGQINLGPNGLATPAINLLTVFKFMRDIWNAYFYPETERMAKSDVDKNLDTKEREAKRIVETIDSINKTPGVNEKVAADCVDGNCTTSVESKVVKIVENVEKIDISTQDVAQDKTSQLILSKWSLIYIVIITMLFWPFMVLATPYFFTGVPIRREDATFPAGYFQSDDVLLLLSWLLGEVSNDRSCLEAVVCRSAPKSSQYITFTSTIMNMVKFFRRWLPYSPRIERLLSELSTVAENGLYEGCGNYYCQNLPESYNDYYYADNYLDETEPVEEST